MSGRVYERKFDWDEARRLRALGWTLKRIAEKYGVSHAAVRRVVDPRAAAQMAMASTEYKRSGTCPDCGTRTSFVACRGGSSRCPDCSAALRTTTVRPTELQCVICRAWLPDSSFPASRTARMEHRRYRHRQCSRCGAKARQAYRERQKIPCVGCGAPCLPASEKGPNGKDTGLCAACYHSRRRRASAAVLSVRGPA